MTGARGVLLQESMIYLTWFNKSEVEEKKEWKIKRYCLIILIKFIQPKWELIELKET